MLKSLSITRLIVLYAASAFLFLFLETRMEHQEVVEHHPQAFIPVIASGVGFLLALFAAVRWTSAFRRLLSFYFVLMFAVGLAGVYFHNEDRFEGNEGESREERREGENSPEKKDFPPMLAPLAFMGVGAVGLLGSLRRWETAGGGTQ